MGAFLKLVLCCINNSRFDETVRECMHAAIWSTEKVYRPKQIWRKKILGAFSSKMRQHFFSFERTECCSLPKKPRFLCFNFIGLGPSLYRDWPVKLSPPKSLEHLS